MSDVRQPAGRPHRADGPVSDLVAGKLRHPPVRAGTVSRLPLITRLARGDPRPIVLVVAPAGYGKTTLLSQWAEHSDLTFAWVSLDEGDNDPKVLLSYIAGALNAVEPIDRRVFDALASAGSSVPGSVVPRLGAALWSMSSPVVLVLDDVHMLRNAECRAAVSVLADSVPGGSRLVLAGREEPPLRVARLRAEGQVAEIGPGDLSLTCGEAASLLHGAGITVGEKELAELYRHTEGWPAGLYLAALCMREGGSPATTAVSVSGADRYVSEYVESEFLARVSPRQRAFLTRTAVLEHMCGPLCDAVLDAPGSGAALAGLAGSNLLLVPQDHRGEWYRYHHLFRDVLLAELRRQEPGLVTILRRRAAAWCRQNGLAEEALEYSLAAGDADAVAGLAEQLWIPTYRLGRITTLQRWLSWLDEQGGVEAHPVLAVLASLIFAVTGRPAEAERWIGLVDRWQYGDGAWPGDPLTEGMAALVRAIACRHGVAQMRDDADEAARAWAAQKRIAPAPALLQGFARLLSGDLAGGDASFADAVSAGQESGAAETLAVTLCERSLVAAAGGDRGQAAALADQARAVLRRAGIEESYAVPLVCAVQARAALHRADGAAARRELVTAQRLRGLLTYAIPHLAVQVRVELTRVHLAVADVAGARTLLREIDELLRLRPALGTLTAEAEALRAQLARHRGPVVLGASTLTAAELRLLPVLATQLSVPEIAVEVSLSPHTIKAQVKSIYRKLDACSRSEAVARCRELGLLEG